MRPIYSQIRNNTRLITTSKMMRGSDYVLAEEVGDKGVLILNRPKALNALNVEMIQNIFATFEKWQTSKSMIIVKSNSAPKVFCAGGDVAEVVQATPEYGRKNFRNGYTGNLMIANMPIPYLALISGVTIGGGVGISVHGKYRIATETTLFRMPEATIGN